MNWLRLYTEITADRKLRRLPTAQRWLWIAVMVLSRKSPSPGRLYLAEGVPVSIEDLADEAAISVEDAQAGMSAFVNDLHMVAIEDGVFLLINWDKRQYKSDDSTPRVGALRKRNKKEEVTAEVERSNDDVTDVKRPGAVTSSLQKRPQRQIQNTDPETDPDCLRAAPEAPPVQEPKRPSVEMWDALTAAGYPEPVTDSEKRRRAVSVAQLVKVGIRSEEIRGLRDAYIENFPGASVTVPALLNHIAELRAPATNLRPTARAPNGHGRATDRSELNTGENYADIVRASGRYVDANESRTDVSKG